MLDIVSVLCFQTVPLEAQHTYKKKEIGWLFHILSSLDLNTLPLGDVTTSSNKEFHGFTTLTAKLFLRNSRRDR